MSLVDAALREDPGDHDAQPVERECRQEHQGPGHGVAGRCQHGRDFITTGRHGMDATAPSYTDILQRYAFVTQRSQWIDEPSDQWIALHSDSSKQQETVVGMPPLNCTTN